MKSLVNKFLTELYSILPTRQTGLFYSQSKVGIPNLSVYSPNTYAVNAVKLNS